MSNAYLLAKNLIVLALLVCVLPLTHTSSSPAHAQRVNFKTPPGFPDGLTIKSTGENLIRLIVQSTRFRSLAHGLAFHEKPWSSFGFTAGPSIPTTERVILFSPDESSYIVSEVELPSNNIQAMYLVNASQANFSFNGQGSSSYSGYSALFCTGTFLGRCDTTAGWVDALGTVFVADWEKYPTGATSACCAFGEWTGVSNDQYGSDLLQGGVAWSGFNLPQIQGALSNGYVLWTEALPAQPVYFTPPSWMNGLAGQTVTIETYDAMFCYPNDNPDYAQSWSIGSNTSIQLIGCSSASAFKQYAWYVFESPASSSCVNGGYNGYCQIPVFPDTSWTGQICNTGWGCGWRNINSAADPIQAYYIYHNSPDTSTSAIASGGNFWREYYLSSN